jgi:hypothetical protein
VDREVFDRLSRLVAAAGTRRDIVRLLLGGALAGTAAGIGAVSARKKRSRGGRRGRVRVQQEQPLCPATCTQNCSGKPLHGGVNLTKCNFNEDDLDGVNLRGANLSKACFGETSLRNADLRGTNVGKACFCGADLRGADFRGSNVSRAQLDCANLGCDTILPNGKRAIVCETNETCCDGVCVNTRNDPANCGVCGTACAVCQGCAGGVCEDLPDGLLDCSGDPLVPAQPGFCTAGPNTGICAGGVCNCGPGGDYIKEANRCVCNAANSTICGRGGRCCEILEVCLISGGIQTEPRCIACDSSEPTNLCCEYDCQAAGPDKFICIPNAVPGVTQCDESFEGCAFNDGSFVDSCTTCGAT